MSVTGVVYRGTQALIPSSMQKEMLKKSILHISGLKVAFSFQCLFVLIHVNEC